MSKSTYLDELNEAYRIEYESRWRNCNAPYKNMTKSRWLEVSGAHNRRVMRQARRSVGKANRLGVRRTARGMRAYLNEIHMLSSICRNNREWLARNSAKGSKQ